MQSMGYLLLLDKMRTQRRQVTPLHLALNGLTYKQMSNMSVGLYRRTPVEKVKSRFFEHTAMQTPTSLA